MPDQDVAALIVRLRSASWANDLASEAAAALERCEAELREAYVARDTYFRTAKHHARKAREAEAERARREEDCPHCGHPWRIHDPEDGKCDSGERATDIGEWDYQGRADLPCPCGRHASYTAMRNAKLCREALK